MRDMFVIACTKLLSLGRLELNKRAKLLLFDIFFLNSWLFVVLPSGFTCAVSMCLGLFSSS